MIEILETIIEAIIWILQNLTPLFIELFMWSVNIIIQFLEWLLYIL